MQFTEAQENAINAKTGTLLVSAGAGSGKTSVLTERIIKKISDKSENDNITDFLVVTFTRASATDLKNKISKAISVKLAEDINNVHLKRQQMLLGRASISTIHSFCYDLIRANFEKLGLPAKFRIADQNEMSIIKREFLEDLLDKYYTADSEIYNEIYSEENILFSCMDFISAVENFIGARDDENIYGVMLKIYEKITSRIDGLELFDEQIKTMREISDFESGIKSGSFFATRFGLSIRDLLWEDISGILTELKDIAKQISLVKFEILDKKYAGTFDNSRDFLTRIRDFLNTDNLCNYDDVYNLCENYKSIKVGGNRIDKNDVETIELKEILDKKNKSIKEKISYIQKLFSHDFYDIKRFAGSYEKSLIVLKDFINRFDINLTAEKMRLKTFEFSDLERYSIKLLVEKIGENGEIYTTDLAKQVKNNYKEIYIDEYQDTNKMQDIIFRAISTETDMTNIIENGNRFMVGDIKQSIYAFRGAKPDIFAGYSKAFKEYTKDFGLTKEPKKIYLKKNFRSSSDIIDFINYIFEKLFSEKLGGIEYAGGEVLESGKDLEKSEDSEKPDVIFALVEKDGGENISDEYDIYDVSDADEDEKENNTESTEAEYVALTVKNLLKNGKLKNGEKILPRHITVLMRNYTKSDIYVDAMKKYEISCYTDRAKGFLSSAEIMLMVSILKTVDNPARDIELAATLKSPVFMFSLDDLIYIKKFNANSEEPEKIEKVKGYSDPLFRYVRDYAENMDGIPELKKKCAEFMSKLNLWRAKSRTLPVDKFIWYIYRQTDIMAKISLENFAAERKANLMLLYEYARRYEETTFKGLYGFLNYLNDVQNGKDDFERAKVISENSDVVKIMSVHKSKGLEFPVCILANTGGLFNKSDYQGSPVINSEGIYFDLKYNDEIGIEKTPFKKIFAEKLKSDMLSEEARILYVALTRAIEKLIIVGNVDNIERFLKKNADTSAGVDFSEANSILKWLTPVLLNTDGSNKTNINFEIDLVSVDKFDKLREIIKISKNSGDDKNNISDDEASESDSEEKTKQFAKLAEMYDFEYKKDFLSKIPTKVLVTKMRPGILTETQDEYTAAVLKEIDMAPLPRFLEEIAENIPALSGIATHLFMQFADFEFAEVFGSQNEAENLLSKKFINETQYSRIKFYPIDRFFLSDLYEKIKSARTVYRETPFNLKVSVEDFLKDDFQTFDSDKENKKIAAGDGEYILVQGAVDLFFEDKKGMVYVVDFKTDQVSGIDGEKTLIKRHKSQIGYYCKAVSAILNKPVDGAYIYSFALNRAVRVL